MADPSPATYAGVAVPSLAPPVAVTRSDRVRPATRLIALLALGHLVTDVNQGSLPALLPFLKTAHGLSYAAVGSIVLAANLMSSLVQPAFGYLSDRTTRRWLLPLSVATSGTGLALTGLAPNYAWLFVLIFVMGLGVAAYHPEGYKTATGVAGDRKATALSWFSLGGNIGVAIGPPLITALVTGFGLVGSLGMLVPSFVMAGLLVAVLPWIAAAAAPVRSVAAAGPRSGVNRPGAMAVLVTVVAVRSMASTGFTTFIPFYYVDYLKSDPRVVGPLLFVFLGAGAVATVIAGPLADRWGARTITRWAFLAAVPAGVLFMLTGGALAVVMLGIVGGILISVFSVSVVLGQAYLPRNTGMASGLIVGFAIGAGGLGVTALGWIADHHGIPPVLWISALLPAAGFVVARFLPSPTAP
jgi:FSR family fosmidomycin resistance protein-like MFS transporter